MILPTREQTWLLRACLLSGSDAANAWQSWRSEVAFDDIEAASYRLLPLLHQNLRRENIHDDLLGRIRGIYRHAWSRNQLLFHSAGGVMQALQAAGIPLLVLKGGALASLFYDDPGRRPMNDFDFMVPFDSAPRAFEIMTQNGWRYAETIPPKQIIWCSHAGKWNNPQGQQIDLHWHVMPDARQQDLDDEVWAHTVNVMIGGHSFQAMDATGLLWHVCAHGGIGDLTTPIRWVADAWLLLHQAPALDWDRFANIVERRSLALPVGRALAYLREEFSAPVPDSILERLDAVRIPWTERWYHRIRSNPWGRAGALPIHCVDYLRQTRGQGWGKRISGAPVFFQRTWGLSSARQLPGYFLKKAWTRLARRSF